MRYIVFILLFSIGLSAFSTKEMYSKLELLKNREKYEFKDITVPYNPFFKVIKMKNVSGKVIVSKKFRFVLLTVLNHKAFINNRWYKQGDYIKGFRVIKIYKDRVILQKGNKKVILKIEQKRKILNIVEIVK